MPIPDKQLADLKHELALAMERREEQRGNYAQARELLRQAEETVTVYENFIAFRRKLLGIPDDGSDVASAEGDRSSEIRPAIAYKTEFRDWCFREETELSIPKFREYLKNKFPDSDVNPMSLRNPFREALEDGLIVEVKKGSGRSAAIYQIDPALSDLWS